MAKIAKGALSAVQGILDSSRITPQAKIVDDRIARAEQMGFDTDKTYYHGTPEDFNQFQPSYGGIYLADDPQVSHFFSSDSSGNFGDVKSVHIRPGKSADLTTDKYDDILDDIEKKYDNKTDYIDPDDGEYMPLKDWVKSGYLFKLGREAQNEVMESLAAEGFDSVRYLDASPATGDAISTVVFNPAAIRSVDAGFDVSKKSSPNLMASLAGGGILAGSAMPSDKAMAEQLIGDIGHVPEWQERYINPNPQTISNIQGYPYLLNVADFVEKNTQSPLGGSHAQGLVDLARKWGYREQATPMDYFLALLDVAP